MNTKLHAVTDAEGRPIRFFMTAGQVSDYIGAAGLLGDLPKADWLLADRGCDADWFREALKDKGDNPCSCSPETPLRCNTLMETPDSFRTDKNVLQIVHPLRRPGGRGVSCGSRP